MPGRASGAIRWLYEWIVELYARYVLIRCSRFTNDRAVVEDIAACTLATTCLLSGELEHVGQLSLLADTMADVVGRDFVRARRAADSCRASARLLFVDESMRELAAALNRLDRFTREVLVLHDVEGMSTNTLARLLRRSPAQVRAALREGEKVLARCPAATRAGAGATPGPELRSLLTALAADLDVGFARPIGPWAFRYLLTVGSSPRHQRPAPARSVPTRTPDEP